MMKDNMSENFLNPKLTVQADLGGMKHIPSQQFLTRQPTISEQFWEEETVPNLEGIFCPSCAGQTILTEDDMNEIFWDDSAFQLPLQSPFTSRPSTGSFPREAKNPKHSCWRTNGRGVSIICDDYDNQEELNDMSCPPIAQMDQSIVCLENKKNCPQNALPIGPVTFKAKGCSEEAAKRKLFRKMLDQCEKVRKDRSIPCNGDCKGEEECKVFVTPDMSKIMCLPLKEKDCVDEVGWVCFFMNGQLGCECTCI